jgi:hypothetical protein
MLGWSRCIGAPASSHPITDRPSRLVLHPPTLLPMRLIVPNPLIYPPPLAPCLALHAPALVLCHMCICSQVRLGMALRLSGSLSWSRPTAYLPAVCSPLRDHNPRKRLDPQPDHNSTSNSPPIDASSHYLLLHPIRRRAWRIGEPVRTQKADR